MQDNPISREVIVSAIAKMLEFEQGRVQSKPYFDYINNVQGSKNKVVDCTTCAEHTKRVHNDFQIWVWSKAREFYPELIPTVSIFNSYKYKEPFYVNQIPVLSFRKLQLHITSLRDSASTIARTNAELSKAFKDDADLILAYKAVKLSYFTPNGYYATLLANEEIARQELNTEVIEPIEESPTVVVNRGGRKSKINTEELLAMKAQDKTNVECASHFGVSKAAISQTLKQLNYDRHRGNSINRGTNDSNSEDTN